MNKSAVLWSIKKHLLRKSALIARDISIRIMCYTEKRKMKYLHFVLMCCVINLTMCDVYLGQNGGHTSYPTDIPSNTDAILLWSNSISSVPNDALNGFTNLVSLNMKNNELTEFPDVVPVAETLTNLTLAFNR